MVKSDKVTVTVNDVTVVVTNPTPAWEPSDEQIKAVCLAYRNHEGQAFRRRGAVNLLKRLHAAGLEMP